MQTDKIDVIYAPLHISRQDWGIIALAFVVSRILLYAIGYFGAMHYNVETDQIGRSTCSIHWKRTYGVYFASLIVRGLKVLLMWGMTPIRMV